MSIIELHTDGSCDINKTKRGGWASLINYGHDQFMLYGSEENTTNNRMELLSVIKGLSDIKHSGHEIVLYSDSKYVVDMINFNRITKWKRNNWTLSNGEEAKNIDLLQQLDFYLNLHTVKAIWVKGHSGHLENEICDQLAKSQAFIK